MRIPRALLTLASLVVLAGCEGDRRAQELARQLSAVLENYRQQVDRKIQAEQASYKKLAELYARAEQEQTAEALGLERRERSARLADALVDEAASRPARPGPSLAQLQDALREYAALDFDRTEKLLAEQREAQTRFLAALEDLQAESQRIATLARLLESLAQPRRPAEQLRELAAFAGQVGQALRAAGQKGGEK
jgi:hypothetical protein